MPNALIDKLNSIPIEKVASIYGIKVQWGRNQKCEFPDHGAT